MNAALDTPSPLQIPRSDHALSRAQISPNALRVLYRLHEQGFRACLVGGAVRDLLLGRTPKDFDICTDAHPEQVYRLFRNSRLIGRRFRLVHVYFQHQNREEIIEVSTFRGPHSEADHSPQRAQLDAQSGRILRDNVYGTITEDAWRRDFTINALYYDIADYSVLDYVGGLADLQQQIIRLIGDPEQRYREDPVRMLRAVRFAAKLGFPLHPATAAPLATFNRLLRGIPAARLFDEVLKLFLNGCAFDTLKLLRRYELFDLLFPLTEKSLQDIAVPIEETVLGQALRRTDARYAADQPISPAFLFAALLWEPFVARCNASLPAEPSYPLISDVADELIAQQQRITALPKRWSIPMRDIWLLQRRFTARAGKRPFKLLEQPHFRAAYDFLVLRAQVDGSLMDLVDWWTQFIHADAAGREQMLRPEPAQRRCKPRKKSSSKTEIS